MGDPGPCLIADNVPGGTADRDRAGGENTSADVMVHCAMCAHCANPCGVLHSADAPFRPRLGMKRRKRLGPTRRATVAPHSGRCAPSVCAPAPLAHRAGPFIPAPVAPVHAHDPTNHHIGDRPRTCNPIVKEIDMTFDIDTFAEQSQTAIACETAALFGATPERGEFDSRDAFEKLRDTAAEQYRSITGEVWRPRHGSHVSQTGRLTSAAIDARDFQRARKDRKTQAHLPQGTLVAIAAGKDVQDPAAVIARLDKARAKYSDLILVHGGGPGVEKIAAQWAERNGVHQIVCKPDWQKHGRATPFRRNDELLNLLPKGNHRLPRLRHRRQPRRQGKAARHPGGSLRRGPFPFVSMPTRQRWHPRARFPSPTRSGACRARAPSSHLSASHRASHECIGDCAAPSAAQSPRRHGCCNRDEPGRSLLDRAWVVTPAPRIRAASRGSGRRRPVLRAKDD